MKVKCYGSRGSIPSPMNSAMIRSKIAAALQSAIEQGLTDPAQIDAFIDTLPFEVANTYGGNTTCMYIEDDAGNNIILDAGSGIRPLGLELLGKAFGKGEGTAHLFITHTHWDHIMGFPFFVPAFIPGNKITIYSPKEKIKERFEGQQRFQYFPIALHEMNSTITFKVLPEHSAVSIGETVVRNFIQPHPGDSYSYRIECNGKSIVFATDIELFLKDFEYLQSCARFFENADILIFDAQYTFEEALQKMSWGHSSTTMAVDMALKAGIKELWLFHHEPTYGDEKIKAVTDHAIKYLHTLVPDSTMKIVAAYEGLEAVL